MVQLSQSQDDEAGDGTTGNLCGHVLKFNKKIFFTFNTLFCIHHIFISVHHAFQVLWFSVALFLCRLISFLTKEYMPSGIWKLEKILHQIVVSLCLRLPVWLVTTDLCPQDCGWFWVWPFRPPSIARPGQGRRQAQDRLEGHQQPCRECQAHFWIQGHE